MGCRLNRLGEELPVVVPLGTFRSLNNHLTNNIFYNISDKIRFIYTRLYI